jgi:hypothetical protein
MRRRPRESNSLEHAIALLKPLPLWRRILAVAGALMMFAGAVLFKITFSCAMLGVSLVALASGVAVLAAAFAGAKTT